MRDYGIPKRVVLDVALFVASQVALYYTVKWVFVAIRPEGKTAKLSERNKQALEKLGHKQLDLDEYERTIGAGIIHPDDIDVKFSDVGGLDATVSSLRESIIYPLLYPSLFTSSSTLIGAPKGVLLYGPPGCGKTMLAKALAKESGAAFINISASALANKWYGESNKLVAGLFSLARKVQPCIIFIDEIDGFLRERSKGDHEVTAMMKGEFMTLWDGLLSATDQILILGATNRPEDIDPAFLRRMPKRFAVGLPDLEQRKRILSLMLKDTHLAPDFPIDLLASKTDGFSGSDLRELCRNAAMVPVREFMRDKDHEALARGQEEGFDLRPLSIADFLVDEHGNSLSTLLSETSLPPSPLEDPSPDPIPSTA
ncbi:ATPase [Fistulina hepatica ATCC 64428]|uniref:ATPase n=1 Tax=Fistulina hepatica ATCC 64428 TaxID=1128425 RepID=A0A0D7A8X5_9AGAR|nr:ATPase [Fistulina hepatica ATCC 64428]